ncbi:MAG: hypothetical protein WA231_19785, partial [Methylocella sp.]
IVRWRSSCKGSLKDGMVNALLGRLGADRSWQFLRPVRFIQVWKIPLALLLQVVSTFGLSLPHFCTLQMHLDPDFEYLTLW